MPLDKTKRYPLREILQTNWMLPNPTHPDTMTLAATIEAARALVEMTGYLGRLASTTEEQTRLLRQIKYQVTRIRKEAKDHHD